MSEESLKQFIDEKFLRLGSTQDQLKATTNFDEFVNLMVSLGNPEYNFTAEEVKTFIQDEINQRKKKVQNQADQEQTMIEQKYLPAEIKATLKAEIQAAADKNKNDIDDAVTNQWKDSRIVEIGIANLRGDDVLPVY